LNNFLKSKNIEKSLLPEINLAISPNDTDPYATTLSPLGHSYPFKFFYYYRKLPFLFKEIIEKNLNLEFVSRY
jgi:hypothetical protein